MATNYRQNVTDLGNGATQGNFQSIDAGTTNALRIPANIFDTLADQVKSGSITAQQAADNAYSQIYTPDAGYVEGGVRSNFENLGLSNNEAGQYQAAKDHIIDAFSIAGGKGSLNPNLYIGGKAPTYSIGTAYTPPTEQSLLDQTVADNKANPPKPSVPASPTTYVPAAKYVILPNGQEVNYAYADPTVKAKADSGQLKTRNDAGYGTPPTGTQYPGQPPIANPTTQGGQSSGKNIFNSATGQYGYQVPGGTLQPGWQWVSPSTPGSTQGNPINPAQSTNPASNPSATVPQAQPATPAVQPPSTSLQPGSTGPEVQALQNYLASLGFLSQEQIATGPGIYGPQTTAAVQAFQQTFGVDNSTGPGYWGPHSIATAQQLSSAQSAGAVANGGAGAPGIPNTGTAGQGTTPTAPTSLSDILAGAGIQTTPQTSLADIVHQLSDAYGLTDIKTQLTTLNSKYADQVANVNDDPWISEAIRAKKVSGIQDKFNLEKQSLMSELSAENTVVGQAITLYNAEQSNQEKLVSDQIQASIAQLNATNSSQTPDIKEYNLAKSEGYTGSFTEYQKESANLKATTTKSTITTPGSTPGLLTQTQINNGASRLGVGNDAFVKLDPQVQTFFAGPNSTKFTDSVAAMSKGGDTAPSYNEVLSAINASPYSEVVKQSMTQYLDKVAGNMKDTTPSSASSGGGSFWDTLVNFVT